MKIDTTKIEGYANMSPEEKLAALEGYDMPEPTQDSGEIQRLKDAVSRANSEAADYKRQLRAKQTDDEAKAAEDAKAREAMQQELESLRRDKAVGAYQAKFLELGYDATAAADAAKALQAGEFDKVFAAQAAFIDATKKAAAAGALDKQPGLSHGDPVGAEAKKQAEIAALRRYMGLPPEKKG
ncbi:hypothetical protein B5G43_02940 [Flavonifractor sp. An92]|uniref:hypothetical protein n=1 Tax=Flavonifractor sp. An92 TaxID=1965666 RepID=UPI000B37E1FB|nr:MULTISPECIES: hypothetical protein [unclassified Flavonifractor]OUN08352.1 hypothetical protein B5G43_02940 [Flavonifractor sp. An92]OUQ22141.1 hypothetical protein B5E80_15185 [Flavonifractor sp. An135]